VTTEQPVQPDSPALLTRPRWTLKEAAERVQVSRSTLRRRLDDGAFPNAAKDATGAWTLGVEDLLGAGFTLARPIVESTPTAVPHPLMSQGQPAKDPSREHGPAQDDELARLTAELSAERARTEVERARRIAAEQLAADRERHVDDLRTALRMLDAGPARQAATVPVVEVAQEPVEVAAPVAEPPRRGVWRRLWERNAGY